jgi:hypothetical protein
MYFSCLGFHSREKGFSFRLAGILGDDVYSGQYISYGISIHKIIRKYMHIPITSGNE